MLIVGILSAVRTGRAAWWSQHLALMLAEHHEREVVVIDLGGGSAPRLLDPVDVDEWRNHRAPSLLDVVEGRAQPLPAARSTRVRVVPGLPPQGRLDGHASVDASLAAWLGDEVAEVVLLDVAELWRGPPILSLARCDTLVVLVEPTMTSLDQLRRWARLVVHRGLPIRYSVLTPPHTGFGPEARARRTSLEALPDVFRAAWQEEASGVPLSVEDDPSCLGVVHCYNLDEAERRPVFDLPPSATGHGVPDGAVAASRAAFHRVAAGLMAGPEEAGAGPVVTRPEGELSRHGVLLQPEGREATFDTNGFLEAPAPRHAQRDLDELLAEHRRAIVVGEAGLGKTFLSRTLRRTVGATPVELGGLDAAGVRAALGALPPDAAVVVDGLDEATCHEQLPDLLAEWLGAAAPKEIWLFSRPGATASAVAKRLGLTRIELLPLTRPAALEWARQALGDAAEDRLGELVEAGLGPLAARPLTLGLLLSEDGCPRSEAELYRLGLGRLAGWRGSSRQEVLRAARALAWALLLGRYERVDVRPPGPAPAPAAALSLDDFAIEFGVDRDIAARAIEALGDGEGRFAHASYAEFLAAEHALGGTLDQRRLTQLVTTSAGDQRIVQPHLTGLVTWLAALDPRLAGRLARLAPGLLLEAGAHLHPDARGAWFKALVGAHRAGRLRLRWRPDAVFGVFRDDGDVARQALGLLADPDPDLHNAACAVLGFQAPQDGVGDALLACALDNEQRPGIRATAVRALRRTDAARPLVKLCPLLSPSQALAYDERLGLRGTLLQALFPEHLDGLEVIEALRPGARDPAGTYTWFCESRAREVAESLGAADVVPALRRALRFDGVERPVAEELLRRAWAFADRPGVPEAMAGVIVGWVRHPWPGIDLARLPVDWGAAPEARFCVLRAIVETRPEIVGDLRPDDRLLPETVAPIVSAAEEADDARVRRAWLHLAPFYGWSDEDARRLGCFADSSPDIRDRLEVRERRAESPPHVPPHVPPLVPPRPESSALARLEAALDGEPPWHVVEGLTGALGDGRPVVERALWRRLAAEVQERAADRARAFLESPPGPVEDIARCPSPRPRLSAQAAWRLLIDLDRAPSTDIWSQWALVLVGLEPSTDPGARLEDAAVARLGRRWGEAVEALLELAPERGGWVLCREHERGRWRDEYATWALDRLAQGAGDRSLLRATLAVPSTRGAALAAVKARLLEDADTFHLVFSSCPDEAWQMIWGRWRDDDEYARAVVRQWAQQGLGSGAPWLVVERAEALYVRLSALFPPGDRPSGVRAMTVEDHASHARSLALRVLVGGGRIAAVERVTAGLGAGATRWVDAARLVHAAESWTRPSLADLARAVPQVRTATDLAHLVIDTLEAIQEEDLDGPASVYKIFFDRTRGGRRRPKLETEACQLLAKLLALRLPSSVVALEVQEHGGDSRVDLYVTAREDARLIVRVEVKWADNRPLTGRDQLAGYLKGSDQHGVLVALWYGHDLGVARSRRGRFRVAWRDDPAPLQQLLEDDAPRRIHTAVLSLRRAGPVSPD